MATLFTTRLGTLTATLLLAWGLPLAPAREPLAPLPIPFTATLSPDQLVVLDTPVDSRGRGEVKALLIGNQLVVTGTYRGLSSPLVSNFATGANIRKAPPGEDGPVVRLRAEQATLGNGRFMALTTDGGTAGWLTGVFTLNDAQVEELKRGLYHVQLYTERHLAGELRGQLGTDLVLDAAVEDLVGTWLEIATGRIWHYHQDGTWTYLSSTAEVEGPLLPGNWQRFEGETSGAHIGRRAGEHVEHDLLFDDGRRHVFFVEAGPCEAAGVWRRFVKLDAGESEPLDPRRSPFAPNNARLPAEAPAETRFEPI